MGTEIFIIDLNEDKPKRATARINFIEIKTEEELKRFKAAQEILNRMFNCAIDNFGKEYDLSSII